MTDDGIAAAIRISDETLRKYFSVELSTGRAVKRAEVIENLFKQMKKGNVSATKKLEEMTSISSIAEDARSPAEQAAPISRPVKLGKKEEADLAAQTAGIGTDWADDLKNPVDAGAKPN